MKKGLLCALFLLLLTCSVGALAQPGETDQILQNELDFIHPEQFDAYLDTEVSALLGQKSAPELLSSILNGTLFSEIRADGLFPFLRSVSGSVFRPFFLLLAVILICSLFAAMFVTNDRADLVQSVGSLCCMMVMLELFTQAAKSGLAAVERITDLMRALVPIICGTLLWSGKPIASLSLPALIVGISLLISELFRRLFLPLIYAYIALSCSDAAFHSKRFSGLCSFLKSLAAWGMGISLTLFSSLLALRAASFKLADGAAVRTVKFAVSSLIPVVGKTLSDVTDVVMGCGGMIAHALGLMGIVLCVCICGLPLLQTALSCLMFRLLDALSVLFSCGELGGLFKCFGDGFSMLFAASASASALLVVSAAMAGGGG